MGHSPARLLPSDDLLANLIPSFLHDMHNPATAASRYQIDSIEPGLIEVAAGGAGNGKQGSR